MVTQRIPSTRRRAVLAVDLAVAMGIMVLVMLPLSVAFMNENKLFRACYLKAVALEIVDGEMEVLAAGEWRAFPTGTHPYTVPAAAVVNLPPGDFQLTIAQRRIRLEWIPKARGHGGRVTREVDVK